LTSRAIALAFGTSRFDAEANACNLQARSSVIERSWHMGEVKGSIPFRADHLARRAWKTQNPGMSDQRIDLMLDHLRAIRGDLAEMKTDLVEIKQRLGLIEAQYASVSAGLTGIAGDIARIKRRLDLVEA
jgi:hypothetical protein